MHRTSMKKAGIYMLILNFIIATFPSHALAALVQTPDAIAAEEHHQAIGQINQLLAREDVREQLMAMGVAPETAQQRIAALTETEIELLQQQLDNLPAGGDSILIIIGIVFLVPLILDLTGVTNVFTKI